MFVGHYKNEEVHTCTTEEEICEAFDSCYEIAREEEEEEEEEKDTETQDAITSLKSGAYGLVSRQNGLEKSILKRSSYAIEAIGRPKTSPSTPKSNLHRKNLSFSDQCGGQLEELYHVNMTLTPSHDRKRNSIDERVTRLDTDVSYEDEKKRRISALKKLKERIKNKDIVIDRDNTTSLCAVM